MARSKRVLPGFPLSLGYTLTYLSLLALIPLCLLREGVFAVARAILGSGLD